MKCDQKDFFIFMNKLFLQSDSWIGQIHFDKWLPESESDSLTDRMTAIKTI